LGSGGERNKASGKSSIRSKLGEDEACTMGITLTPDIEQRIAAKVESGEYQSTDEVVRACLDLLDARDASMQRAQRTASPNQDSRPIWEVIAEIGREIPEEEWSKLPTDLSSNVDHYLYGSPRSGSTKTAE
jgi:putative addiction module CopG family antidote